MKYLVIMAFVLSASVAQANSRAVAMENLADFIEMIVKQITGVSINTAIEDKIDSRKDYILEQLERTGAKGALFGVNMYTQPTGYNHLGCVPSYGFGDTPEEAWDNRPASLCSYNPNLVFNAQDSFLIWIEVDNGELVQKSIPYPFYLDITNRRD